MEEVNIKVTLDSFSIPYVAASPGNLEANTTDNSLIESLRKKCKVSGLKILIAEDDETSDYYLRSILKPFSNNILSATNGLEAVNICRRSNDIDLVMMDIKMHVLDGYDATRQIRQFNDKVIIVAQTAFALFRDKQKAINAGCNDYISKPISLSEFHAILYKHFL